MKNQKFHGQGRLTYANGSYYDGEWVNGIQHGTGIFEHPGSSKYEGTWING